MNDYPPEIREFLDVIFRVYGQFSATRLELMTHEEPPWLDSARNEEISLGSLREFFSKLIQAGREGLSISGEPMWPTNEFRFQSRRSISARMAPHREKLGRIVRQSAIDANPWADED